MEGTPDFPFPSPGSPNDSTTYHQQPTHEKSPVSEVLREAWALHEFTDGHLAACLDWLEGLLLLPPPAPSVNQGGREGGVGASQMTSPGNRTDSIAGNNNQQRQSKYVGVHWKKTEHMWQAAR